MDPSETYVRTGSGVEKWLTVKESLGRRARVAFFLVDGVARADEILAKLSGLRVTSEDFDELISARLIAPKALTPPPLARPGAAGQAPHGPEGTHVGEDRCFIARQFMNETAANAVGLRSFFFTLKLEKANSLHDLRLLLLDYSRLIEKGTGNVEAEILTRRARELTQEE